MDIEFGRSSVLGLLEFYRNQKPKAFKPCIINGVSCSQRWEKDFQQEIEQGKSAPSALLNATIKKIEQCAELNDVSTTKSALILVRGTLAGLMGINRDLNNDDEGPGHETIDKGPCSGKPMAPC